MVHTPEDAEKYVPPGSLDEMTPEQEEALESHLQRVRDEKRLALQDPGPSWRQWFLYKGAKAYVILAYLILDSWVVAWFLLPFTWLGLAFFVPVLIGSVYLEILLYLYLWYRPSPEVFRRHRLRGDLHPTWNRPVRFGRWTPEAADVRAGRLLTPSDGGPDASEFL